MIDWSKIKTTRVDLELISQIVTRAGKESRADLHGGDFAMDLELAHAGCPLDLDKLLDAGSGDFWHDVGGIANYLNRNTGELMDCFVPQFAKREEVAL